MIGMVAIVKKTPYKQEVLGDWEDNYANKTQ